MKFVCEFVNKNLLNYLFVKLLISFKVLWGLLPLPSHQP